MVSLAHSPATIVLLVLNVLISGYALYVDPRLIDRYSFRPRDILQNRQYYRLISAGFVHAGLGHLLFNMLTLYFFGPVMEQLLGAISFYVLYFGSEMTAHLFSLYMNRKNPNYAAIGASGAVSGVVFAFCLVSPFTPLYLFFIPIPIPAILFAVLYVLGSVYAMRVTRGREVSGGIAHEAHIGGALGGVVLAILLEPSLLPHFLGQIGL